MYVPLTILKTEQTAKEVDIPREYHYMVVIKESFAGIVRTLTPSKHPKPKIMR
jgi:hypothetical protein